MEHINIEVARDFTSTPFGRYKGDFCAVRLREDFIAPALRKAERVTVDLTGTHGVAPSYLQEAFGGLVETNRFTVDDLVQRLEIVCATDASRADEAWAEIRTAGARQKTLEHAQA